MLHWIVGIIVSIIIGGAINSLSESVNNTDWKPWVKTLVKIFIWIFSITITVLMACLVALSSGPNSQNEE